MNRALRGVLSFGAALALASSARADGEAKKLKWDDDRPRFRAVEYVATGVLGPLAIAEYFTVPAQSTPHWTGGILFDEALRDAIRLRTPAALQTSWAFADATGTMLVLMSVLVDSVVIPIARGSTDVAWQLLMMDAESFTLASLVAVSAYDTIGRARPPYVGCADGDPTVPRVECTGSLTASFPSGHIAEGFNSAGLSCAHHLFAHVYGNRVADAFACARDLALATTEGVLRMMGDRHYFSDVVAGSLIGFGVGFGMPSLLHYVKRRQGASGAAWYAAPLVGRQTGVALVGTF